MDGVKAMGNVGFLPDVFDVDTLNTAHSGTEVATTLPMSEADMAAARARPMGFVWPTVLGQEQ